MLFVFVDDFWIALFGGPVVGCIFAFGVVARAAARHRPEHPLNDAPREDRYELIARMWPKMPLCLKRGDDKASRRK